MSLFANREVAKRQSIIRALEEIPAYVLNNQLLSSRKKYRSAWLNEAMTGSERIKSLESVFGTLSASRLTQIRRLQTYLAVSEHRWTPYVLNGDLPSPLTDLDDTHFSADDFMEESFSVRGLIRSIPVTSSHNVIIVEFRSLSAFYRRYYRYILCPSRKILLVEKISEAADLLDALILPILDLEGSVEQINITSLMIKRLSLKQTPLRMNIRVTTETSGVDALDQLTIRGRDVLRGNETLRARHQINPLALGPWVGVETESLSLSSDKGILLKQITETTLETLCNVLVGD